MTESERAFASNIGLLSKFCECKSVYRENERNVKTDNTKKNVMYEIGLIEIFN